MCVYMCVWGGGTDEVGEVEVEGVGGAEDERVAAGDVV